MTIKNISDFCKHWGCDSEERLKRSVYKNTDCGAWIEWDEKGVTIGSIVEGSDAEFSKAFSFPVDSDLIDEWVWELEVLCVEAWEKETEEWCEKDYGPSNPWDAPGMKVSDFITGVSFF